MYIWSKIPPVTRPGNVIMTEWASQFELILQEMNWFCRLVWQSLGQFYWKPLVNVQVGKPCTQLGISQVCCSPSSLRKRDITWRRRLPRSWSWRSGSSRISCTRRRALVVVYICVEEEQKSNGWEEIVFSVSYSVWGFRLLQLYQINT